ncbi:MAG TPA: Gfo/Idh/MocA family oxidoreductase [Tepidisphaeraceae bacterium]|nr:Gfo/Idh/MocA family oxidoreductase [Tepidisphaeraceae bacterium]
MTETKSVSRRSFLTTAAVAAAAVPLSGGPLLADAPRAGGESQGGKSLRWGIIGTGNRGTYTHLPTMKEAPESELLALCDIAPDRLHTAASHVGHDVATYSDYQKLLANPDINAVVISTPNLMHRQMLRDAIQAGKHVLCEKPAGATPADAAEMKRDVDAAKTVIMFGMQYRNNVRPRKIVELISAGEIGKPKYIVQNCSRGDWNLSPNIWRYTDPKLGDKPMNWRFSHAASGGTLNEFSCHYLDLLHWFAGGLPDSVWGEGGISVYHDGRDTWDHASVTLHYPSDVTAVHTLCLFGPGRADVTVVGEHGSIESVGNLFRLTRFPKHGAKGGNRIQELNGSSPPSHGVDHAVLTLYEDFLTCVKTGKKPDADVNRAVAASRTCWLAEESSDRRAEVKWAELASAR